MTRVVAIGLAAMLAACGGGDSAAAGASPSGAGPAQASVGSLPASGRDALCRYYLTEGTQDTESSCTFIAVRAATTAADLTLDERRAECVASRESCLGTYDDAVEQAVEQCHGGRVGEGCAATVAEAERCIEELAGLFAEVTRGEGTCATSDFTGAEGPSSVVEPTCAALLAECPDFFRTAAESPGSTAGAEACARACQSYQSACGLERCPDNCDILLSVYGEPCDGYGEGFFDCAATGTFDCAEDDVVAAAVGCRDQREQLLTCYALDGQDCRREEALDESCTGEASATPFAKRCLADAAPPDCVPYLGSYSCCATP